MSRSSTSSLESTPLARLAHSDLKELDQGGELWNLYREAAASSLYFFSKAIWAMVPEERNAISKACHLPLCLTLEDESITRLLVEFPRRHLKTTLASQSYPVFRLVKRVMNGEDPCDRIGIYSASKLNSRRIWREIKWNFEGNEFFQFLFPELIPDFEHAPAWNGDEGIVPRTYNPKEPTFDTLGGGSATSRHYDMIIEDDMITEDNFRSLEAILFALELHRQAENLLEDYSGRIITVGNRWTFNDLNHYIHTEEPNTAILSVSVHGPNLSGKYSCRHLPEPVMELLRRMPDPIWPERFTKDDLAKLLEKLKPRIFSAQYLNNPADPDAVDFQQDWLKYCELDLINGTPCIIYDDDPVPMPLSECNLYVTWDPAVGGKYATSKNAIAVTAIDWKGRASLLREYLKKEDPHQSMITFIKFCSIYRHWLSASGMEEVLFQKVLKSDLQRTASEMKVNLRLKRIPTSTRQNKDQRIRTALTSWFEGGKAYVRRGCNNFLEQYSMFGVPNAPRDMIDCVAYAAHLWSPPPSPEAREYEEKVEKVLPQYLGVTGYGSALRR